MRITFALVAHGAAADVIRLIRILVEQGHTVAVHYDLRSPQADFDRLRLSFADVPAVRFARRIGVAWGEWSIVQATLNCLDRIAEAGWNPDYVYYLSGMDYPIRPSAHLQGFLERNRGDEFIETVPADTQRWVKTGPQRERYLYRWPCNWRDQKRMTELLYLVQRWAGLRRRFVRGLTPFMGSQWWVLTWQTLCAVAEIARCPDIVRFFRLTLVPDELFFQTLVAHVADPARIVNCPLTLYQFSDYGHPVVYELDHHDYLLRQNFFFARKISVHRPCLRDRLDPCWSGEMQLAAFPDDKLGVLGGDCEDWRAAYRSGPPGCGVAGRSQGTWYENLKRIKTPHFVVLGASTLELGLVHAALAGQAGLCCHGQLFHPDRIEFAGNLDSFGGYGAEDLRLRDASAPGFVADVVAAGGGGRLSGYLLRRGQGWHLAQLAVERPNVRVVVVGGDPLVAFCESLLGPAPLLSEPFEPERLRAVPPSSAVLAFRRFLPDLKDHLATLDGQLQKARSAKPSGWIVRINPYEPPDRWVPALSACLGLPRASDTGGTDGKEAERARCLIARGRAIVLELLAEGGVGAAVLDQLEHGAGNLELASELL